MPSRALLEVSMLRGIVLLAASTAPCADEKTLDLQNHSAAEARPLLNFESLGLRYGFSGTSVQDHFQQTDAFASWTTPYLKRVGKSWEARLNMMLSCGWLHGRGANGFVGTAGPNFQLGPAHGRFHFDFGSGVTLLSHDEFGDVNFGIPLQFTSHLGLSWETSWCVGFSYRFQHMSNASLANYNPGLDLHAFGMSYRF